MKVQSQKFGPVHELHEIKLFQDEEGMFYIQNKDGEFYKLSLNISSPDGYTFANIEQTKYNVYNETPIDTIIPEKWDV